MNTPALDTPPLELRDIHLPEPISWWPIAPGWWFIIATTLLIIIIIFITRKVYLSRQLKRDINAELTNIKQQFQTTQDKSQLARALSILLRRTCITYYPREHIAGLTGNDWLHYLDASRSSSSNANTFQSDIGQVLLNAPYLPDNKELDFDAQALIELCESWLTSAHKKTKRARSS